MYEFTNFPVSLQTCIDLSELDLIDQVSFNLFNTCYDDLTFEDKQITKKEYYKVKREKEEQDKEYQKYLIENDLLHNFQTITIEEGQHKGHKSRKGIYIQTSTYCDLDGGHYSGCISFEDIDNAKKSLRILLKQLEEFEKKDKTYNRDLIHTFKITPEGKLKEN